MSAVMASLIAFTGCDDTKYPNPPTNPVTDGNTTTGTNSNITLADGYGIGKLLKAAKVTCGTTTYESELTFGTKGLLTFKGINLADANCGTITLEANSSKIDRNNDGKEDANDTLLTFEMSTPSDAKYVTPLTTLLVEKIKAGASAADVAAFKAMVLDFNPVSAATDVAGLTGSAKLKIQKLMVSMEVLKVAMKAKANVTGLDLNLITSADENETLGDFNVSSLVSTLPATLQSEVKSKAETILSVVELLDTLDPAKVDLAKFMVSISDGGQTLIEAFRAAIKDATVASTITDTTSFTTIMTNVVNAGIDTSTVTNIANNFTAINSNVESINNGDFNVTRIINSTIFNGGNDNNTTGGDDNNVTPDANATVLTLGETLTLGSKSVAIAKDTPFELNVSSSDVLSDFYNIKLLETKVNKTFDAQTVGLQINVTNKADANDSVEMTLTGATLSTTDGVSLQTKFTTATVVGATEKVAGTTRSSSAAFPSELTNGDLSFDVQTIVDTIDNTKVNNAIGRMNGYLQTAGKSYDVSIELTDLNTSVLTTDFTTITGVITVQ